MQVKGREFLTSESKSSHHDATLKKSREEGSLLDKRKGRLYVREAYRKRVSRSTSPSKRVKQAKWNKGDLGRSARPVSPPLSRGDRELASSPSLRRIGSRFFRSLSPSQRKGQSKEWDPDQLSTSSHSSSWDTMSKLTMLSKENHGTSFDRSIRSTSTSCSTTLHKERVTVSGTKEAAEARREKRLDKESKGVNKSSREPALDPIRAITPTKGRRQKNEVSIEFVAVPNKLGYSPWPNNGRHRFHGLVSCNGSDNPTVMTDFSNFMEEQGRCDDFDDLKEGFLAIPKGLDFASQQMTQCCHAEFNCVLDDEEKAKNRRQKLDSNWNSKASGVVLEEDDTKRATGTNGVMEHPSGRVVWRQYQGDKEGDEAVELEETAKQKRSWWRLSNAKHFVARRASTSRL